jgi:hypothetical protein
MTQTIRITAQQYWDGKTLINLIKRKRPFESHKASSYYARAAGVQGTPLACGFYQGCPDCGKQSYYAVLSYNTLMFGLCSRCGASEVNMGWYSNMTRVVQQAIATVFASAALALAKQRTLEEEAEDYYQEIRSDFPRLRNLMAELNITLGNGRRKAPNKREKLELFLGHKLAGRFITEGSVMAS